MRKFLSSMAGASFNQELPTQTVCVRKDCVELIYKVKPSVYVIVSLLHVGNGEVMLFVNWAKYFDRLQNQQVQMPRIENRRQAESHPSLLEDGRGAKEEDDSQELPYALCRDDGR